jgi:feruloyl esterase
MTVFRAQDYVGKTFDCSDNGATMSLSAAAADVAEAIWSGPKYSNGDFMWYGYDIGTNLSTLAATSCTSGGGCIPESRTSLQFWWQLFVLKDLSTNVTTLTHAQFDQLYITLKKEMAALVSPGFPSSNLRVQR